MRAIVVFLGLTLVTACGADGEPVQPTGGVNVTLGGSGAALNGTVGVRKGPVTLGLGF